LKNGIVESLCDEVLKKIVVHNARNVKIQKHPQMTQMNADKNKVTGWGLGALHTLYFIPEFL